MARRILAERRDSAVRGVCRQGKRNPDRQDPEKSTAQETEKDVSLRSAPGLLRPDALRRGHPTVTVPFMLLWMVHWKLYVPALANVSL